ncbi:MAG: twin-arginine translocase subunit TatC [Gammaproteobacteria bacterium]
MADNTAVAKKGDDPADSGGEPQSLIEHLIELRTRLMRIVLSVLVVFAVMTPFGNDLYTLASAPLSDKLPEGTSMIAIKVAAPFLTPIKMSFLAAVFITIPVTLYQIWAFVAPGLYKKEKRLVVPLLVSSTLLFYMGAAFAYFVVFPVIFGFLTQVIPDGVQMSTDITSYLDFMIALFVAFGIAFETPIAIMLLVWTGFATPEKLAKNRAYVFLGAFVVGMFLTPPDFVSQTLLAVPMYLLFEVGLFMSRRFIPGKPKAEQDAEAE